MVKNLKLLNFRNYAQLELNFDNRPTVLVGDNAAGKSNILEAVYLLSTTKSQRVGSETELIKQGEDVTRVQGDILEDGSLKLEVIMEERVGNFTKRVKVNGIPR